MGTTMTGSKALKRVAVGMVAAVLGVGGAAYADHPGGGGRPFRLVLTGTEERPVNPHGAADRGTATLRLNPGQEEVCFSFGELTLTAGEPLPFAGHIHRAPAGEPGPVVIGLFGGAMGPAPTSYPTEERCVFAPRALILEIIRNPENFYVNLHNATHTAGVVRAQLS